MVTVKLKMMISANANQRLAYCNKVDDFVKSLKSLKSIGESVISMGMLMLVSTRQASDVRTDIPNVPLYSGALPVLSESG